MRFLKFALEQISLNMILDKNKVFLYLDESQDDANDHLYLCVTLILSEYFDDIEKEISQKKEELAIDQHIGINKKKRAKLFHHNDDNEEVRSKYVDVLRQLFFKSYISRITLSNGEYSAQYNKLLKSLLKHKFAKYKDRDLVIRYEQNSKINKLELQKSIKELGVQEAEKGKFSLASLPIIEEVSKADSLISIPDYCLGCFLQYQKEQASPQNGGFKIIRFQKIQSKVRLAIDLDNSKYYSRSSGAEFYSE
jgi:hypothetical protein